MWTIDWLVFLGVAAVKIRHLLLKDCLAQAPKQRCVDAD